VTDARVKWVGHELKFYHNRLLKKKKKKKSIFAYDVWLVTVIKGSIGNGNTDPPTSDDILPH